MNVYKILIDQMYKKSSSFKEDDFIIKGLWKVELVFKPNIFERNFKYTFIIAQTIGQGCCYCNKDIIFDSNIIGKNALEFISEKNCISIAILDSIFHSIPKKPKKIYKLENNSIIKAYERSSIIIKEAERLMEGIEKEEIYVVNVGVVGNLIKMLKNIKHKVKVFATDFDPSLVDQYFQGVKVESGFKTLEYIKRCDLAIITGMTLSTDTLDNIIETAKKNNTKLLMFAETGANFAEEYCNIAGVDVVISEEFPFYIFQGTTRINVYRRD